MIEPFKSEIASLKFLITQIRLKVKRKKNKQKKHEMEMHSKYIANPQNVVYIKYMRNISKYMEYG